jgi:non-ribosomal peptide synthetase component F
MNLPSTIISKDDTIYVEDAKANPVMLQQIFERTVDSTPDIIAVVYETKEYSYQDLDLYANRIAHHFQEVFRLETEWASC